MEKLHSFHVDAVYVHFSSEKSSDNQLSFDSIVAQSIWHAVVLAFIFRRTKNPNPAEVGIQEDDSVVLFVSHEHSIVRIECQIMWMIQFLCFILWKKTTDDQPSVSRHLTNDEHSLLLLLIGLRCLATDVVFQRVKDDEMPAGCLHCMKGLIDV